MILVIAGIHKILFPLGLAVVTARAHEIPVDALLDDLCLSIESILTLSDIFDDLCPDARLLMHFAERSHFMCFTGFHGSLRKDPSLVAVSVILVKKKNFPVKDHDAAAARCFNHCNSSCADCQNI